MKEPITTRDEQSGNLILPGKIQLGDTVSLGWKDGYDNGTVCQVHTDGTVDVFRVYVHHTDVSYAGRGEGSSEVICYIGTETVQNVDPSRLVLLHSAGKLR